MQRRSGQKIVRKIGPKIEGDTMKTFRQIRTTLNDARKAFIRATLVLYLVFGISVEADCAEKENVLVSFLTPNLVVVSEGLGETLAVSVFNINENSIETIDTPSSTLFVAALPGGNEKFSLLLAYRPADIGPPLYIVRQSGQYEILETIDYIRKKKIKMGWTTLGIDYQRVFPRSKRIVGHESYIEVTKEGRKKKGQPYVRDIVLSLPSLVEIDKGELSDTFVLGSRDPVSPAFGDNDEFIVVYKESLMDFDSPFVGQLSIFRLNPFKLERTISVGDDESLMAYADSRFNERCYVVFRNMETRKNTVLQITATGNGSTFTENEIEVLGNTNDTLVLAWSENFEVWLNETNPGLVAIPRGTGESSRIVLSQELQSNIVFSDSGEYLLSVNEESGAVSLWHFDKEPVLLYEDITAQR